MEAIALDTNRTYRIPLLRRNGSVRMYTVIEDTDFEFVSQWTWRLGADGYAGRSFRVDGKMQRVLLHRELLGLKRGDGREGDHINRKRLDNRRSNLRVLPEGANQQNRPSYQGSSSRFRGVTWHRGKNLWSARVKANGKRLNLGYFASEEEAGAVARAARLRELPYAID